MPQWKGCRSVSLPLLSILHDLPCPLRHGDGKGQRSYLANMTSYRVVLRSWCVFSASTFSCFIAALHCANTVAVQTLTGHLAPITALDFSEPYGVAVTASLDESVRLWDLTTGDEMGFLKGHRGTSVLGNCQQPSVLVIYCFGQFCWRLE